MKKKAKIAIILSAIIPTAIVVPALVFTLVPFNNQEGSQDPSFNQGETTLTNNLVKQKLTNEWKDKKVLTADDLKPYSSIENNAFDGISSIIESIEIPSNVIIKRPSVSVQWIKIRQIKIKPVQDINNIFILNNILFIKSTDGLFANTIADRITTYNEIYFPCYSSPNQNFTKLQYKYNISSFFYLENIFRNIGKIKFYNDVDVSTYTNPKTYYNINYIGEKAFNQCQKFDNQLTLVNCNSLLIEPTSFNEVNNVVDFNLICANNNQYSKNEKVISLGAFSGYQIKNFRIVNTTNSSFNILLWNIYPLSNYIGQFVTSSPEFNFEVYLKSGTLSFLNNNPLNNEPDSLNWNKIFNRLNDTFDEVPFERFNMSLFVNNQPNSINFLSTYDLLENLFSSSQFLLDLINLIKETYPLTPSIKMLGMQTTNPSNFNLCTNYNDLTYFYTQVYSEQYHSQIKKCSQPMKVI